MQPQRWTCSCDQLCVSLCTSGIKHSTHFISILHSLSFRTFSSQLILLCLYSFQSFSQFSQVLPFPVFVLVFNFLFKQIFQVTTFILHSHSNYSKNRRLTNCNFYFIIIIINYLHPLYELEKGLKNERE